MQRLYNNFNIEWNKNCNNIDEPKYKYNAVKRVIAIGDIHGDYNILIDLLKLSKVIDNNHYWCGGNTYVIQLGDQIDGCRPSYINNNCKKPSLYAARDIDILNYMTKLNIQANVVGGKVISLLGNHELMNVDGNMDYVTYEELIQFSNNSSKNRLIEGTENRRKLFSRGNEYAKMLGCTRKVSVIIGNTLFVHGGIIEEISEKYDLNDINKLMTLYLFNTFEGTQVDNYNEIYTKTESSPLWTRFYSTIKSSSICDNIYKNVMKKLNIERIIVGHTVLKSNKNNICDNKIIFADCHASIAFNSIRNHKLKKFVIEILNDNIINFIYLA